MADERINNIEALVNTKLASLPSSTSRPCIYKIPPHLFELNEKAYLPKVVSIGPIYCDKPNLQAAQELKLQLLQCFLQETSHLCSLKDYLRILGDNEGKARSCYAETVSIPTNELILMLLIDAVFLIEHIMQCHLEMTKYRPGLNLSERRGDFISAITHDIYLEENQIPFFILELIYDMSYGKIHTTVPFPDLACTAALVFLDFKGQRVVEASTIEHLFHLMWCCMKPTSADMEKSRHTQLRFSVSHLKAAGVEFRASQSKDLLDITFDDGVLWIPKIGVTHTTESIYRSLIIFELCHNFLDSHFIDYTFFLNELINTPEDIRILVQIGIIKNMLGSDDALAHFFNTINQEVVTYGPDYNYAGITNRLNAHASDKCNQWKAMLKSDYFGHPWAIISVIYAVILLLLTIAQTVGTFTQH